MTNPLVTMVDRITIAQLKETHPTTAAHLASLLPGVHLEPAFALYPESPETHGYVASIPTEGGHAVTYIPTATYDNDFGATWQWSVDQRLTLLDNAAHNAEWATTPLDLITQCAADTPRDYFRELRTTMGLTDKERAGNETEIANVLHSTDHLLEHHYEAAPLTRFGWLYAHALFRHVAKDQDEATLTFLSLALDDDVKAAIHAVNAVHANCMDTTRMLSVVTNLLRSELGHEPGGIDIERAGYSFAAYHVDWGN